MAGLITFMNSTVGRIVRVVLGLVLIWLGLMGPLAGSTGGVIVAINKDADAPIFKEFPVSFAATGKSVDAINAALLERGILGGASLKRDFPWLGESALYAVTEIHGADEIERLATSLEEVLR